MANRIKGITVEINGDTTKLSKALEGVNKNIKSTQTQLLRNSVQPVKSCRMSAIKSPAQVKNCFLLLPELLLWGPLRSRQVQQGRRCIRCDW